MLVHGLRPTSHSLNEDVMLCYEYNNDNINSIQDIQTADCREYSVRNSKHTSTWLVVLRALSDIITISFSIYLNGNTTYTYITNIHSLLTNHYI